MELGKPKRSVAGSLGIKARYQRRWGRATIFGTGILESEQWTAGLGRYNGVLLLAPPFFNPKTFQGCM